MTLEELILDIIRRESIQDQKSLLKLISTHGFEIDQSTLSRIFKKLNIQKILGKYSLAGNNLPLPVPTDYKISIVPPNLIVIKTKPGYANAISSILDENPTEGVVGTIAGDDTVFIAVSSPVFLEGIQQKIEGIIKK